MLTFKHNSTKLVYLFPKLKFGRLFKKLFKKESYIFNDI